MEEHYPETESLKAAIEAKMGKRLSTPADFTDLVAAIERETGEHVGITTVKRLWGYIGNDSRMREGTLSVFARFVGYADWTAFCVDVRERGGTDSSFLTGRQVLASSLAVGDCVEIGWLPDRYCLVRHGGVGRPLYVADLVQADGRYASYVAGERNGLTLVRVMKK